MRSLLARLAVLGALAVSMSGCGGGTGSALPFAGGPNIGGGQAGVIQTGSNGQALVRFIQGSPDVVTGTNPTGAVDVCLDNLSLGILGGSAQYAKAATSTANSGTLVSVTAGIAHTVAVYNTLGSGAGGFGAAGSECQTAPGPYFGSSPLVVTTVTPAINGRLTIVLAGTHATNTFGIYLFTEPSFVVAPAGSEIISHNAAPAFSSTDGGKVGFGTCSTTSTPCVTAATLPGAGALSTPKVAAIGSSTSTAAVTSAINAIPAGFYDGVGVSSGTVVPITSIAAPNAAAGQPYIIDLYAIDAPAGGLGLVPVAEQALGYGF
jgi:hypothetical protein